MATRTPVTDERPGHSCALFLGVSSFRPWLRLRRRVGMMGIFVGAIVASAACGSQTGELPPDVQDPASIETAAGAVAFYRGVLGGVSTKFDQLLTDVGTITDELAALPTAVSGSTTENTGIDSRINLERIDGGRGSGAKPFYKSLLNSLRAQARNARGFLGAYAPESSPALRGHLYALEGYAEIWLADVYCSGIPLSTLDFQGDYTLAAGSTTEEVYTHAVMLFDSALALASDSVRIQHFAAVGRGRALLAMRRYDSAAAAVAAVPNGYQYQLIGSQNSRLLKVAEQLRASSLGQLSVADREGVVGLDYRSSNDPRSAVIALGQDMGGNTMYMPIKYPLTGLSVTYTLANGVEARLIEAEAALQAGNPGWLTKLNALRTDGTFDTQPNASDPTQTDTLWHAGSGGTPGLRPLSDPMSPTAQVDLVFRERAFWLFLTAHRQGDLRRLIRNYARTPESIYPNGFYAGATGQYGMDVVVSVPEEERRLNPKYTGCVHRNA